ncbi:hypothetical protein MYU51_013957 [Penicillium brevicompactum]
MTACEYEAVPNLATNSCLPLAAYASLNLFFFLFTTLSSTHRVGVSSSPAASSSPAVSSSQAASSSVTLVHSSVPSSALFLPYSTSSSTCLPASTWAVSLAPSDVLEATQSAPSSTSRHREPVHYHPHRRVNTTASPSRGTASPHAITPGRRVDAAVSYLSTASFYAASPDCRVDAIVIPPIHRELGCCHHRTASDVRYEYACCNHTLSRMRQLIQQFILMAYTATLWCVEGQLTMVGELLWWRDWKECHRSFAPSWFGLLGCADV